MGRCPVRSVFPQALEVLEQKQDLVGYVHRTLLLLNRKVEADDGLRFMFENIMPLSEAPQGYQLFDQMKVQKVVFKP